MTAKEIVTEYMTKVWVEKDLSAIDRFVEPNLIQHNPNLQNRRDALAAFLPRLFEEMPGLEWRIIRIIAEDDMVVVHSHAVYGASTSGTVVVDFFRVSGGKIVEHWDVTQDVPDTTASGNTVY